MTLAWIEPWDFYADLPSAGVGASSEWNFSGGDYTAYSLIAGLLGGTGLALQMVNGNLDRTIQRAIPSTTQVTLNFYARYSVPDLTVPVLSFLTSGGSQLCKLQLTQTGRFQIVGQGNAVFATGNFANQDGVVNHYRILYDVTVPNSSSFKIYINGDDDNPDIDISGVDLQQAATNEIGILSLNRNSGDFQLLCAYDHMICLYNECSLVPELELYPLAPTGDDTVAWTKSTGATNYGNVDEAQIDSDTTYNHSSVLNQKDLFTYPALGFVPDSIHSISLVTTARKEESATQTIKQFIKIGATEYPSDDIFLSTTYVTYFKHYDQNPATLAGWVPGDLPIKTGYELTS